MKYVNIRIEDQSEIGVIGFNPPVHVGTNETQVKSEIVSLVEPKLIEALESHFDCEVKIFHTDIISYDGHIRIESHVLIGAEGADYYEDVEMVETWIY